MYVLELILTVTYMIILLISTESSEWLRLYTSEICITGFSSSTEAVAQSSASETFPLHTLHKKVETEGCSS